MRLRIPRGSARASSQREPRLDQAQHALSATAILYPNRLRPVPFPAHPFRSDGKLTVKSLAEEAGVKRWLLTHKHTDLQDEFRARIAARDTLPPAQQALADEIDELRTRNAELSEKLAAARDEAHQLARVVQVLTLENEQLRSATDAKVRPLRPGR